MHMTQGGSLSLRNLVGSFILVILCLGVCTCFTPVVHAEQALVEIEPVPIDLNVSPVDYPGVITGGGKGYYRVYSNVDGAEVYFNHDWYQGTIENSSLLVQTCLSCTPVWTFTVKKCGYFALTQNNTRYPHQDEVIELYANLTRPKEPLIPDFTANITGASAAPLTVGFTSHSVGIVDTWNWSFGDGAYSEEAKPVHTYTANGAYTVSLFETNSACQNNTMVKKDYITVGTPPKPTFFADFTVTPTNGIAPMTVQCTDKSTGNPTRYSYNFGDGVTVAGPNPFHTYRYPGTYNITLTITKYNSSTNSIMGVSTTKTNVIRVNSVPVIVPVAKFTASPTRGAAPLTVTFTDQSTGNPTRYNYNFGDGYNVTEPNPTHIYRYPGIYNVTLTVLKYERSRGVILSNTSVQKDLIVVDGT
jgi:PKD repeat protein